MMSVTLSEPCKLTGMDFLRRPPQPGLEQLFARDCPPLYLAERVSRVTTKRKRLQRTLALGCERLYLLEVHAGTTPDKTQITIKRNPRTSSVMKLVYSRPTVKGVPVDQVLLSVPTQIDMLLEFPERSQKGPYGNATNFVEKLTKLRYAQEAAGGPKVCVWVLCSLVSV
eukprot:TRINITY_DN12437_c0_g1_i2.p1 TRINITY_DN12437_c0_g1~~TRINITY_DN12437_c0_g1_i2.p1  ORF type:complete len:169 (+),score=27.90 TRINITY_DN12437_c0_g1_i2:250-756(+)